ncbi:MAG: hypothetical protein ACRCUS_04285 [Anaerovoracaceae bacterium]
MKKKIIVIGIIVCAIVAVLCGALTHPLGIFSQQKSSINIQIAESNKFSEKEIEQAVDVVIKQFKSFNGCRLTDIWYAEDLQGDIDDINTIILMSDFYVFPFGSDASFEPNSTYRNWQWELKRKDRNSDFQYITSGYGNNKNSLFVGQAREK